MQETKCVGGLSDSIWGTQYHQQDRVYSMGRLALALPAQMPEGSYKYLEIKKITEDKTMGIKILGMMDNTIDNTLESANRVYDSNGISPCISTCCGGGINQRLWSVLR